MAVLVFVFLTVAACSAARALYHVCRQLTDLRRRRQILDKIPGRKQHPLWGFLHEVIKFSITVLSERSGTIIHVHVHGDTRDVRWLLLV